MQTKKMKWTGGTVLGGTVLLLLLACLLITETVAQKSQKECTSENEFWGCQSPTRECQRLCENKKSKPEIPCNLTCEQACVCEAGYLRNGTKGLCVYDADCPKNEGELQEVKLVEQNKMDKDRGGDDRDKEGSSDKGDARVKEELKAKDEPKPKDDDRFREESRANKESSILRDQPRKESSLKEESRFKDDPRFKVEDQPKEKDSARNRDTPVRGRSNLREENFRDRDNSL